MQISSEKMNILRCLHKLRIACQSSSGGQQPVGLWGKLTISRRVFGVNSASRSPRSNVHSPKSLLAFQVLTSQPSMLTISVRAWKAGDVTITCTRASFLGLVLHKHIMISYNVHHTTNAIKVSSKPQSVYVDDLKTGGMALLQLRCFQSQSANELKQLTSRPTFKIYNIVLGQSHGEKHTNSVTVSCAMLSKTS